jgi:hypothetical protein
MKMKDLKKEVPLNLAMQIFDQVRESALQILDINSLKIELCGAYRRGHELGEGVDILITRLDFLKI